MQTLTVNAVDVQEGDFITGLDNGYVFEAPDVNYDIRTGENTILGNPDPDGEGYVMICFHDANGNENYLIVAVDNPITVERD